MQSTVELLRVGDAHRRAGQLVGLDLGLVLEGLGGPVVDHHAARFHHRGEEAGAVEDGNDQLRGLAVAVAPDVLGLDGQRTVDAGDLTLHGVPPGTAQVVVGLVGEVALLRAGANTLLVVDLLDDRGVAGVGPAEHRHLALDEGGVARVGTQILHVHGLTLGGPERVVDRPGGDLLRSADPELARERSVLVGHHHGASGEILLVLAVVVRHPVADHAADREHGDEGRCDSAEDALPVEGVGGDGSGDDQCHPQQDVHARQGDGVHQLGPGQGIDDREHDQEQHQKGDHHSDADLDHCAVGRKLVAPRVLVVAVAVAIVAGHRISFSGRVKRWMVDEHRISMIPPHVKNLSGGAAASTVQPLCKRDTTMSVDRTEMA